MHLLILALFAGAALAQDCDVFCPAVYDPICGSDGRSYSNSCSLGVTNCRTKANVKVASKGRCADVVKPEVEENKCLMMCPFIYRPVCASNSKTFSNECLLKAEACRTRTTLRVMAQGRCADIKMTSRDTTSVTPILPTTPTPPPRCNMICPMNYMPVCGSNGKTYGNACGMNADACRTRTSITMVRQGRCDN